MRRPSRMQWIGEAATDARYALRTLSRARLFSGVAIAIMALGIAANVAIFSVVNAVVLRPLRFPEAERLAIVREDDAESGLHHEPATAANYLDWRDAVPAFSHLAAVDASPSAVTLTGDGDSRNLRIATVTGDFFATLGVRALVGRTLTTQETWNAAPRTVVLSYGAWQREFGASESVVGRSIMLDGESYQVIGIMPAWFAFPWEDLDGWLSFRWDAEARTSEMYRRVRWLSVIGRLRDRVSLETANAQLQTVSQRLQREHPRTNARVTANATPLDDFVVGDTRLPLLMLLASVIIMLLIACTNVGNLLLVRAAGRQREVALRLALGAGHMRLVRYAITESLILSAMGGVCGLALGWAGTRVLMTLQPDRLLPVRHFAIDTAVATYVVAITVISGLLFGLAPALWAQSRDPGEVLKDASRGGTSGIGLSRWGEVLVITEVALALILNVGAGLLARSFWNVARIDPGFDPQNVLAVGINTSGRVTDYAGFFDQLLSRARTIPGVTGAAQGMTPLYTNAQLIPRTEFAKLGQAAGNGTLALRLTASPDYFSTLRVPLRRGRVFSTVDHRDAPKVVVINETLARESFGGEEPIGQSICFQHVPTSDCEWHTIVGVVGDIHDSTLEQAPRPAVYESTLQRPIRGGTVLLRTSVDPATLASPMRSIVRELQPQLAIGTPHTLDEVYRRSMSRPRFYVALLGLFAVVGLVLAVVGVYGMVAQLARRRTRELGIRMALGATSGNMLALLVRHALRPTVIGIVVGAIVALLATRAIGQLLFNLAPHDPLTFAAVALLLAAASLVASWIPAATASRTDPAVSLRDE